MNQEQIAICHKILNSLLRRPIAKLFWEPLPNDLTAGKRPPISFKWIIERLDRGLYSSADEWIGNVHVLLSVPHQRIKSSLRGSAAVQLAHEFDILTQTLSPALSPHILQLQLSESKLAALLENTAIPVVTLSSCQKVPAAEVLKEKRSDDLPCLAEDIRNLFAPNLVLRVAAFVSIIEPPALILDNASVRILLFSMSPTNQGKLRTFVSTLIENAANGTIDPFIDKKPALLTQVR